jgi:hypothetical protein
MSTVYERLPNSNLWVLHTPRPASAGDGPREAEPEPVPEGDPAAVRPVPRMVVGAITVPAMTPRP